MRRISENVFGILKNCWRVFRRSFHLEPQKIKSVILPVIIFHSWLRRNSEIAKVHVPQSLIYREDLDNDKVLKTHEEVTPPLNHHCTKSEVFH